MLGNDQCKFWNNYALASHGRGTFCNLQAIIRWIGKAFAAKAHNLSSQYLKLYFEKVVK